jgi:hypothetical protein
MRSANFFVRAFMSSGVMRPDDARDVPITDDAKTPAIP